MINTELYEIAHGKINSAVQKLIDNLEEYFSTGNMLTRLFNNNFEEFKIKDSDILSAGPKTDLSA